METVEIEGTVHNLECNAWTPFVYSEEFTTKNAAGKVVPDDVNAAAYGIMTFTAENGISPMLPMLRFFWAFEKTATPKLPGFKAWLHELPASVLDLTQEDGWSAVVTQLIKENFFRATLEEDVEPAAEQAPAATPAD